ncbi:MAG: hypothetical protein COU09_01790 [Candidatus Harrisonbacteria bacterium CG10_big_fil_rev_8_21_14_0_10_44_23]|uniref:Uncharacterized protein n=1 Tax=Candidatus Harrisonbacteria bacterium CG10_big_fil_rev_8_21_14_0_10_44_23 TaxID=1974585 RepID=A0A2H0UQ40_9BACT|nr:MAG: hypothetical protein COU09_01790 [Candidatus Harrisonbacteria bacterium CG10_big_fil_rev_8_21_14_0_10_44_23]
MIKKIFLIIFLGIILLGAGFLPVSAQEIATSTDDVVGVESGDLTVKKDLIEKVLLITHLEIDELKSNLKEYRSYNLSQDLKIVYENFNSHLKQAEDDLDKYSKEVEVVQTTEEIRDLAHKIKSWRTFIYDPINQELFNFISLLRVDRALETALSRLDKVGSDLREIEPKIKNEDSLKQLEAELLSAQANLEVAKESYAKAKALTIRRSEAIFPIENVDINNENIVPEEDVSTGNIIGDIISSIGDKIRYIFTPNKSLNDLAGAVINDNDLEGEDFDSLLRQVLTRVKTAYSRFIRMSEIIRAI